MIDLEVAFPQIVGCFLVKFIIAVGYSAILQNRLLPLITAMIGIAELIMVFACNVGVGCSLVIGFQIGHCFGILLFHAMTIADDA